MCMEGKPQISVLMCTYNHEQYIAQAIEGVLQQKCDVPFELLIGEDGGQDRTREIVMQYVGQHPDIVKSVFPERNLGASKNIINLAKHAQGEVLSVCDGDDWWHRDDILQKQWETFQKEPKVGMFCAKAKCYRQKLEKYDGTLGYEGAESLERMVKDNRDVAAPTIAFRKELFLKCASECGWYVEQNCFYDSIMAYWFAYYSKIRYVDEELASYRVLEQSACHTDNPIKTVMYSRRYFSVKWRFLLEHPLDSAMMHELLMKEYDVARNEAGWMSDVKARSSMTYQIGKRITEPLKRIIRK